MISITYIMIDFHIIAKWDGVFIKAYFFRSTRKPGYETTTWEAMNVYNQIVFFLSYCKKYFEKVEVFIFSFVPGDNLIYTRISDEQTFIPFSE